MRRSKFKNLDRSEAIIIAEKGISDKLDGYNRLKDNVLYLMDGGKNKILQIESSVSGESKTTVVCNLAVLLGQTDKRVLVLDLDFRRAGVHQVFHVDNETGLAEYMLETASLEQVIKPTEYNNVDVLPRGSMIYNSSLVFISERFKDLISKLRDIYDLIIIDTTPVLQMSDFIHVSKFTDATIFLVAYKKTKKAQVRDAVNELRKNKVNIIGTVFTFYDSKRAGGGSYYYNKSSYYTPNDKKGR